MHAGARARAHTHTHTHTHTLSYIKPKALSAPPPPSTWKIVATPVLPFRQPGKDWLCVFNAYFIYPIYFAQIKMFHIISLSFLFRLRSIIFFTPSLNKNEEPARWNLEEKKRTQLVQFYKTADTQKYSTHPFETSPPPPPPGCLEVAHLLNSPLSTHPFETTGGGGYLERVCPSRLPPRSHPVPATPPFKDFFFCV